MAQEEQGITEYTYRSMELIREIKEVHDQILSKLSICLTAEQTIGDQTEDAAENCELNRELKSVLDSLQMLNRRINL